MDPEILVVLDAGYGAPRIAYVLGDLPVQILGRMRSDRVLCRATPTRLRPPGRSAAQARRRVRLRRPRHVGHRAGDDDHRHLHGTATAQAWDRLHPRLTRRAAWAGHEGLLPIIEGTMIRLQVDHLPGGGARNRCGCCGPEPTSLRQTSIAAGRRSCAVRHRAHVPPVQANPRTDRTQAARSRSCRPLDLDRHRRPHPTPVGPVLAADLRRPWEKPLPANRLIPARVRRGFRNIRATTPSPARAPKPSRPGLGRPTGSKPASRHLLAVPQGVEPGWVLAATARELLLAE